VRWISTTIFAWWTGNDFDVGTLSNLCGGYLPPYLHGGLAMILICGNPIQFVRWISTTIFAWWIGNDFDVGTLSNLCGGYLPPYLHGGLAMI
jgi:hypothetical protein